MIFWLRSIVFLLKITPLDVALVKEEVSCTGGEEDKGRSTPPTQANMSNAPFNAPFNNQLIFPELLQKESIIRNISNLFKSHMKIL